MVSPINPKVTAATAALAGVALVVGLIEWLAGVDVPSAVEAPAAIIATFAAGWLKADGRSEGKHAAH